MTAAGLTLFVNDSFGATDSVDEGFLTKLEDTAGTGGGTIGTGQAPLPQEQGFTGNGQLQQQGTTGEAEAPAQQPPPMATLQ